MDNTESPPPLEVTEFGFQKPINKGGRPKKDPRERRRQAYHNKSLQNARVPPGYVTRAMILETLGISASVFQSARMQGWIHHVKKNSYGIRIYTIDSADALARRLGLQAGRFPKPGEDLISVGVASGSIDYEAEAALRVADMIKEGRSLFEIFREMKLHPRILDRIVADLTRFSESMFVPKETLDLINKLPLQGTLPIMDPDDLYHAIRCSVIGGACVSCRSARGEVCRACAGRAQKRAAQAPRPEPGSAEVTSKDPTEPAPR